MGATNEVESGFFHHTHVTPHAGFGHGIAPSGMILMYISPSQIEVLAIQEEAFVCRPLHPSESQTVSVRSSIRPFRDSVLTTLYK